MSPKAKSEKKWNKKRRRRKWRKKRRRKKRKRNEQEWASIIKKNLRGNGLPYKGRKYEKDGRTYTDIEKASTKLVNVAIAKFL